MKNLISVIVPCYNQAQYLDECLQSVLDQTYENWECLMINDGSPDNTEEVAKKWIKKDSRFKYFYKENGGLSSARNFGIEKSTGEWILPLDSDDYISKNYLNLAQKQFDDNELKVIYSNAQKFGAINEKWELPNFSLEKLAEENVFFCSSLFRRKDWERIGGYDENLRIGYEDWEFWINMLKDGGNVIKIEDICFFYRIKENSMIRKFLISDKYEETFKYIGKKHVHFFYNYFNSLHFYLRKYRSAQYQLDIINNRLPVKVINYIYSLKYKIRKL